MNIFRIFEHIALLDTMTDWIEFLLKSQAILAPILLLLIEEMGIPLPVPGDIYIAYMGYQVSVGAIPYPIAFLGLMASVLIGSSVLYFLSYKYGQHIILKFGKYLHLNEARLETVEKKFKKYGPLVIVFGRHIPGFRIPITFFAGISDVTYKTFIISTFFSIILWIPFYLGIGQGLGKSVLKLLHQQQLSLFTIILPLFIIVFLAFKLRLHHHVRRFIHHSTKKRRQKKII